MFNNDQSRNHVICRGGLLTGQNIRKFWVFDRKRPRLTKLGNFWNFWVFSVEIWIELLSGNFSFMDDIHWKSTEIDNFWHLLSNPNDIPIFWILWKKMTADWMNAELFFYLIFFRSDQSRDLTTSANFESV